MDKGGEVRKKVRRGKRSERRWLGVRGGGGKGEGGGGRVGEEAVIVKNKPSTFRVGKEVVSV